MRKVIIKIKKISLRILIKIRNGIYYFFQIILARSYFCPRFLRRFFYNLCGCKIKTKQINPKNFIFGNKLKIGKKTFINYDNFFDLSDKITIGENVRIAMRNTFVTSTHEIGEESRRGGQGLTKPIVIEDGCWIGANCTILPGVTIHKGTIIGAGSLVNKDCDANSIYVGVPAKKIKDLNEKGK